MQKYTKNVVRYLKPNYWKNPGGRSFACEIWDKKTDGKDHHDNCIGENFNQLVQIVISDWFDGYIPTEYTRPEFYVQTYIVWLYLFFERIEYIFNEINPDRKFGPIQKVYKSLTTMEEIRLWANFIKHPKNFFFVHWPHYIFVDEYFNTEDPNSNLINTAFLKDHYSSEKQPKPIKLDNKSDVTVQYPKLPNLTAGFCRDLKQFFRFVCDNQMVIDELQKNPMKQLFTKAHDQETY